MNSFFREMKQRKVYRVALGFAVVAWLAIQISATANIGPNKQPEVIVGISLRN